jgi:hypothetical protein
MPKMAVASYSEELINTNQHGIISQKALQTYAFHIDHENGGNKVSTFSETLPVDTASN